MLTLGRLLLVAVAVCLVAAAWRDRATLLRRPPPAVALFVGGLVALWVVITVSATTRGCYCAGAWHGYTELAALSGAAAVVVWRRPESWRLLTAAAAGGSVLAAVFGLAGIQDVNASEVPVPSLPVRIGGPYGNPNFLGFAVTPGIPVLVGALLVGGWRQRGVALAALVASTTAVAMTFSRGAILAAGIGTVACLAVVARRQPRAALALAGAVAVVLAIGALGYDRFDRARTEADFSVQQAQMVAEDRSGWNGNASGPLAEGPSRLSNDRPSELTIRALKPGQGASLRLDRMRPGRRYRVDFEARTPARTMALRFGFGTELRGGRVAGSTAAVSRVPRRFSVSWRPTRAVSDARFYVWAPEAAGAIILSDVTIRRADGEAVRVGLRLLGPVTPRDFAAIEREYVGSRITAFKDSLDAFASAPLVGIGWQRFERFAAARDPKGALATHNEYVRIAAELGIVGLVAFALVLAGVLAGLRSVVSDPHRAGVVGGIVAAAVGLAFVNGIVTPTASVPLGLLAGVVASRSGRTVRGDLTHNGGRPSRAISE